MESLIIKRQPLSEETKRKISIANKGRKRPDNVIRGFLLRGEKNPLWGIPRTDEIKNKISLSNKGKIRSEETIRKNREGHIGIKPSEETKAKKSLLQLGEKNPFFGKRHSEETRMKMVEAAKHRTPSSEETRKKRGDGIRLRFQQNILEACWYGNVTYPIKPQYCEKFNKKFKERVRAYWNYQCFECGTPQNGTKLHVHHVHYDKKTCCNGSPQDIIPLCNSCHSKTNGNRDYWEDYFTELLYAYDPEGKCFFTKDEMKSHTLIQRNG